MEKNLSNTILILCLFIFLLRIPMAFNRPFDPDEFEHFHAAWKISQGERIYTDFFEHHPPMTYWLLQPFFLMTGDTMNTLYAARLLMVVLSGGIFFLNYLIARNLWGPLIGAFSVLLLSTMIMFLEKSVEIRPDVPLTFCWLACLFLILKSLKRWDVGFFPAGLFLGLGLLFSPKVIFGYLGVLFALCILWYKERERGVARFFFFHLGILMPTLIFIAWLLWSGTFADFWRTNVVFNAGMSGSLRGQLMRFILRTSFFENILFWLSGLLGILAFLKFYKDLFREKVVLISSLIFLILGLFINPVPHRQYYLLSLPILSMTGSLFLIMVFRKLFQKKSAFHITVSSLLVFLLFLPLRDVYAQFSKKNRGQRRFIEFVLNQTSPSDCVFDCWTGFNLFRRDATYYYFLNLDILRTVDRDELDDRLFEDLSKSNCKVAILNNYFSVLPERVQRFINRYYSPSEQNSLVWIRNPDP